MDINLHLEQSQYRPNSAMQIWKCAFGHVHAAAPDDSVDCVLAALGGIWPTDFPHTKEPCCTNAANTLTAGTWRWDHVKQISHFSSWNVCGATGPVHGSWRGLQLQWDQRCSVQLQIVSSWHLGGA